MAAYDYGPGTCVLWINWPELVLPELVQMVRRSSAADRKAVRIIFPATWLVLQTGCAR
jgi:hypothetical protein